MILSREVREKFTIFIFVEDIDQAADLRGHLAVSGYEVFMFRDQETLVSRAAQAAPHLIVFELEALQTTLSEFVEKVLAMNSEVLFLPMIQAKEATALQDYREFNFAGIHVKGEDRDLRLLWSVDQICSELFYQYQNEQLLDQRQELQQELQRRDNINGELKTQVGKLVAVEPFEVRSEMEALAGALSKEEALDLFLKRAEQKLLRQNATLKALVLKFLPTLQSFVATQSLGLDLEKMKGIGARIEKNEADNLIEFLKSGGVPTQLRQLMGQGLGATHFDVVPLMLPTGVEALLVFWSAELRNCVGLLENELSLFQLVYLNYHLQKRLKETDTRDQLTDFESRGPYLRHLDEEVARARRLQRPVSVVKLSVDHLVEIEQSQGTAAKNAILKAIATMIQRTSRVNDISSRTDENEFALILPHSAKRGAAVRAERIRRMVENHSFSLVDHKISLSAGVSEYPSLCATAEELESSAGQALEFIQGRGGNKVCLFKARAEHNPDFDVPVT